MDSPEDARQLWTGWLDHGVTGEGRNVAACILYSTSEDDMRRVISERFDSWFAQACQLDRGVVRNEITRYLWSERALQDFERIGSNNGWLEAYSKVYIDFS